MGRIKRQAGFTIIEVMLVTMIMGVLASLVLPSIRVNAIRVKMSEALIASGPCKNAVTEVYLSGGDPQAPNNWGCEVTTNATTYVDSVTTDDIGTITVSLRGFNDLRIDFHNLTLAPLDNTGNLPGGAGSQIRRWRCGALADGTDDTLLPFLPSGCRG